MMEQDLEYMRQAIELARQGVERGDGGPFGALVVIDHSIIGRGWNQVVLTKDPTAHAEINAIRAACTHQGHFHLHNATLYTSCEPCPMCLGAAYWAHIDTLVYAATAEDAKSIGFTDQMIRLELRKPTSKGRINTRQCMRDESVRLFRTWADKPDRTPY